jgi:hypothetical protein
MVVGTLVGVLLTQFGLFFLIRGIGLLLLGSVWSYVSGFGIIFVGGLVVASIARGWPGAVWWTLGIVAKFVTQFVVEFAFEARLSRLLGEALTAAEVNFFNAYRLHAERLGVTPNLEVSDVEIETDVWRECLLDYAEKYPEAVARFPDKLEVLQALQTLGGKRHGTITERFD